MRLVSILVLATLTACTAADVQPPQSLDAPVSSGLWSFEAHENALREASCPKNAGQLKPQSIDIKVIAAEQSPKTARENQLTGLKLAGAWQLKSEESNFGGLSGLDVLNADTLLSVTDAGAFVWIGLDPETGAPNGSGSIAYMRGADGNYFSNKRDGDAEGLSIRDGLALVSFEQDHRIAAFDLDGCGAAARAAEIVSLAPVIDGRKLADNGGPEGLALSGDKLSVGFEFRKSTGSPFGALKADGTLADLAYTSQPQLFVLTGMDEAGDLSAKIFRAYDPVRGARVILQVDRDGARIADAFFKSPLPVDNFEGVAIGETPSGAPRIWVISDDNFNPSQRTLLLALDLDD